MAVVKADAYGHGSTECARKLEAEKVDWLAVATTEEAVELRTAGIEAPILCLGGCLSGQTDAFFEHRITPAVLDIDQATALEREAARRNRQMSIHVKIDTGMGRVGLPFRHVGDWLDQFSGFANLSIEGLMTHFAAADVDDEFTRTQLRRFDDVVEQFRARGHRPTVIDAANSPATVGYPAARGTMVRVGGMLYGLGDDVLPANVERPALKPVMSLKTAVTLLKFVPAGETIGYGRAFRAERESLIATLPIGYHDGLRRGLSNRGRVIVNGRFAPIVGRISMDWTTIDVTDVPNVEKGDDVVIIGSQNDVKVTAADVARHLDTISYEITCGVGRRVPRIYIPQP